ncbi:MAG TPA: hypothetical protein VLH58_03985 [Candidatus Methylomirabilis sp.]|nr:hypothetical protein [Candidatus Methylomirabilis sp.]
MSRLSVAVRTSGMSPGNTKNAASPIGKLRTPAWIDEYIPSSNRSFRTHGTPRPTRIGIRWCASWPTTTRTVSTPASRTVVMICSMTVAGPNGRRGLKASIRREYPAARTTVAMSRGAAMR